MVFQNYALYPHMTVADNMGFALKIAGVNKTEIRKQGRGSREDPRPQRLPGPQAEGALRWSAPACRDGPGDRPGAAGLPHGRAAVEPGRQAPCLRPVPQIASLQRRLGITTVYVTHDQVEAMTMGDRVAVLKDGLLQQVDSPREHVRPPRKPLRRRLHRLPRDEPGRGPDHRRRREVRQQHRPGRPVTRCPRRRTSGDTTITVGVRPEHFEVVEHEDTATQDADQGQPRPALAVSVSVVEELGADGIRLRFGRGRAAITRSSSSASTAAGRPRRAASCTSCRAPVRSTSSPPRRASASAPDVAQQHRQQPRISFSRDTG